MEIGTNSSGASGRKPESNIGAAPESIGGIRAGVDHYGRNTACLYGDPLRHGRDIIVGDIHGAFYALDAELGRIRFDPAADRLFSVGDLIDRGPDNEDVLRWLALPWFHAVQGNHEDLLIAGSGTGAADHRTYVHMMNGGDWFYKLSDDRQQAIAAKLAALPVAIELETELGLVGIVHAECPFADWYGFTTALDTGDDAYRARIKKLATWSRDRFSLPDSSAKVNGVRAVVCGHCVDTRGPVRHADHIWIETAGWHPAGHFTLLDAATLEPL